MLAFVLKNLERMAAALPATFARVLLVIVVVSALVAHHSATSRIADLERASQMHEYQMGQLLLAMQDLTGEVRAYRADQRDEIKALRARRNPRE